MQAMTHSVENVQHCARAVELVVAGPCYAASVGLDLFWQTAVAMKKRGELCNR